MLSNKIFSKKLFTINNKTEFFFLSVIFLILLLLFSITIKDYFSNSLVFNNDERQQIMPYLSFHQPEVLNNSLIKEYFLNYTPIGHRGLYYLLTLFLTANQSAKIVTFMLLVLLLIYCFKIGNIYTPIAGLILTILVIRSELTNIFIGGLPRSFGCLLIFVYIYYFYRSNEGGILITFVLQALFYPPSLLICGASYVVFLLSDMKSGGIYKLWGKIFRGFLVLLLSLIILLPLTHKPEKIGSIVTLKEAKTMKVFGPNGRFRTILPFNPINYEIRKYSYRVFCPIASKFNTEFFNIGSKGFQLLTFFWFMVGISLLYFGNNKTTIKKIICILLSATMMHLISRILAFRLFLPSRLIEYSWPIVIIISCSCGIATIPNIQLKVKKISLKFITILLFLISISVFTSGQNNKQPWNKFALVDCRNNVAVYNFFKKCSPDSVIAGDPHELDNIIYNTGRDIYVSYESAHPFYITYWNEIERRFDAFHKAYFAHDREDLINFFLNEKIDYFIVNINHFSVNEKENKYALFEPFDSKNKKYYENTDVDKFYLSTIRGPGIIKINENFIIIDTKEFMKNSNFIN